MLMCLIEPDEAGPLGAKLRRLLLVGAMEKILVEYATCWRSISDDFDFVQEL